MARTAQFFREDFGVRSARPQHDETAATEHDDDALATPVSTQTFKNKPYGWYSCDTTPHMLASILGQALQLSTSAFDAIMITGDFVAHNQLDENSTRKAFEAAFNAINNLNTNNLPVLVTVGNEDFYPDYGMEKCYDEQLYHMWEVWSG